MLCLPVSLCRPGRPFTRKFGERVLPEDYISARRTPRRNVSCPRPASMTYASDDGAVTNSISNAFDSRRIVLPRRYHRSEALPGDEFDRDDAVVREPHVLPSLEDEVHNLLRVPFREELF